MSYRISESTEQTVRHYLRAGRNQREVAKLCGISKGAVARIALSANGPQRATSARYRAPTLPPTPTRAPTPTRTARDVLGGLSETDCGLLLAWLEATALEAAEAQDAALVERLAVLGREQATWPTCDSCGLHVKPAVAP